MTKNERPVTLVVIDHDPHSLDLISSAILRKGLNVICHSDPETGLREVLQRRPEIVLVDLMMPKMNGMKVLEKILATDPGIEVILITANYSTESAVEGIQKGASDYLTKPLDLTKLRNRIEKFFVEAETRKKSFDLDRELLRAYQFEGIVGRSPLMLDLFAKVRRIAPHFQSVLISAPTGSGKELVSRALHNLSPAQSATFAVCNCSAIVETLFESELFGYVRGAFTGATQDKVGLFEYANGGTVFLDEIGEMPLAAQAKLLRVLQNQEIQRVGSPLTKKVNVRIIAATHRDLRTLAAEGKFREDLFYRLSMVEIEIPRLADRKEDLPLLQRHFLEKYSAQYKKAITGITRRAQTILARHSWPGNVRELENVIGNACMMVEGELIDVHDIPEHVRNTTFDLHAEDDAMSTLEEVQRRHMLRVLKQVNGNKVRAAEVLGISRGKLYNLLAKMDNCRESNIRSEAEILDVSSLRSVGAGLRASPTVYPNHVGKL
ncbi:MAG: two component, sigma54 specific, transcriptional regulator, Fis family [Acidobacteriaceae bacterium]|nr:two component, sigma54 specific, transcriptional regulator, Fis family [Acidobacteriaceae bacterium]